MRYGFFNSEITGYDTNGMPIYDRAEEAAFFAKYFSQFISTGVFANPSTSMQVVANVDMTVKVLAGACFINGYMGWVENPETLTIEETTSYSRIDRVVARLSISDRKISLAVLQGEEAANPVAPDLTQDSDLYEIALAEITVTQNTIEITDEEITDLRLDTDLCGVVTGAIDQVDTTTLFNQYLSWYESTTEEAESDLEETKENFQEELDAALAEFKEYFDEWFANLQVVLSEDVAANLQVEIEANATAIEKLNDLILEAVSPITTEDGYILATETDEEYIVGGI